VKNELRELVKYRIQRAEETLVEAEILFANGHFNTFVNRIYYACFYAVNAILLAMGASAAKHSGVRALLHRELIKTGKLPEEMGRFYDKIFDNRQKADYADLVAFLPDDVGPWMQQAKEFVSAVNKLITAGID